MTAHFDTATAAKVRAILTAKVEATYGDAVCAWCGQELVELFDPIRLPAPVGDQVFPGTALRQVDWAHRAADSAQMAADIAATEAEIGECTRPEPPACDNHWCERPALGGCSLCPSCEEAEEFARPLRF